MATTKNVSTPKKSLVKRALLVFVLFLVAGSISYPQGANWLIGRVNALTSAKIPSVNFPIVLGLDLQGGTHLEYVADLSKIPEKDRQSAMDGVRNVIERRVNQMGVSEPTVLTTKSGEQWRLTIELAGVRDINQAIKMIGETPILEFREENPDAGRALTEEETKALNAENETRTKVAEEALTRVQSSANFDEVARDLQKDHAYVSGAVDAGWLSENTTYAGLLDVLQGQSAGLVKKVVDDGSTLAVVDIKEKKSIGSEVSAAHLLIQWKGAERSTATTTKEEAKALIEKIAKEATSENFDTLVRKYSQEPGAAETGGDLGWFKKGDMVEAFENKAFGMETNKISEVIETPFGFHLIKKTGERPREDMRATIIAVAKQRQSDIVDSEPYKRTDLTGKNLQRATLDFDPQTGSAQVSLQFDGEGSKMFSEITRRNIGKPVAIYLDGTPISIPTVQNEIPSGQAVISGNFTIQEAKELSQRLQAGALPVAISLVAQQSVGPVLGAESVSASLVAGLVGFLFVIIFMVMFYRVPGLMSVLALVCYSAIVIALFKLIPVTLSMSGIAGFILSIGIAVDANVLIFERMKEELKSGKALGLAIDDAFTRAWPSIRDGNATTLIVCLVLFLFTSSLIKGFALTLSIGIVTSMFSAIVITRVLLKLVALTPLARIAPWLFLKSRSTNV
ncbi:MAG: protein translocase subunit SecD [Candidatus Uhrbacteria bacterium]|nr:protein translocase subunit SecD [Candidatus Uhrbacteria bacterium]